mmetsp:Transcript_2400/g.5339  ORF Transcript_2400/g.5339 Transcript_2400/m.5339 type:complete len:381 (+) Transcript_2400:28-1170(+)
MAAAVEQAFGLMPGFLAKDDSLGDDVSTCGDGVSPRVLFEDDTSSRGSPIHRPPDWAGAVLGDLSAGNLGYFRGSEALTSGDASDTDEEEEWLTSLCTGGGQHFQHLSPAQVGHPNTGGAVTDLTVTGPGEAGSQRFGSLVLEFGGTTSVGAGDFAKRGLVSGLDEGSTGSSEAGCGDSGDRMLEFSGEGSWPTLPSEAFVDVDSETDSESGLRSPMRDFCPATPQWSEDWDAVIPHCPAPPLEWDPSDKEVCQRFNTGRCRAADCKFGHYCIKCGFDQKHSAGSLDCPGFSRRRGTRRGEKRAQKRHLRSFAEAGRSARCTGQHLPVPEARKLVVPELVRSVRWQALLGDLVLPAGPRTLPAGLGLGGLRHLSPDCYSP